MEDNNILKHINKLVAEEEALRSAGSAQDPSGNRLRDVEHQLDQCWDLLRQRRALREFGRNPDDAALRDAGTVEGYKG
ncbi:DUF2630 family protein [Acidovorax sp.]|uniref:DUF2630 family protein n=1 Tax=Acidovorax sp. TaxID=1872122 RepID=UPI002602B061|nr:DUF2630 family protein [Acidovorax sp.]